MPINLGRWLAAALIGAAAVTAVRAESTTVTPTVTIDNFSFTPAALTVPAGATVTWINQDDIPHTVTSADPGHPFKSEPLDTGERFMARFDHPGRFGYFCSLHAHMQGVIVVQ